MKTTTISARTPHDYLRDIIRMLADISVQQTYDFDTFLKKLIKVTMKIVPVDSCLIYVYQQDEKNLVLAASKRPHNNLVGTISMTKGEGITGWVMAHKKPVILENKAYEDDRFKSFKELPEDTYEAFCSIPIIGTQGVVGVINLQNKRPYVFSKEQVEVLEAVGNIVSLAFAKITVDRKVTHLEEKLAERKIVEKAKGVLMKERSLSEKAAYALLQKEAMKKRKTMREIAEAVLLVYS